MKRDSIRDSILEIDQNTIEEILENPQEIERAKSVNALISIENMLFYANPFMPSLIGSPK